jgi:hypothetical protein
MDDKYLSDFFEKHRQVVSDKGFSDRLMRHLPVKQHTPLLVWIFAGVGFFIVLLSGSFLPLINLMADFLRNAQSMRFLLIISSVSTFILFLFFFVSEQMGTGYIRKKKY